MFLWFDYKSLGFSDMEWDAVPRGHKIIIRDYELNGRDVDQTSMYDEYLTSSHVGFVRNQYKLDARPHIEFVYQDFALPIYGKQFS